ncbi:MAG: hypothetical protein DMF39_10240 [Verrucomicrobia bacterium]|nr:MAG: hypothetical protein DMF39_10240 [Verrucomicrobiota bacterium]
MAYVDVARQTPQGTAQPKAPEAAPPPQPSEQPAGAPESSAPIAPTETESRKKFTKSYGP